MPEAKAPDPPAAAPEPKAPSTAKRIQPAHKPPPVQRKAAQPTVEQQRVAMIKRWKQTEDQFNRLWDRLEGTIDPDQRDRLINRMAQYVRMNTLDTVEWAMDLGDPEERRLALEAINQYALSGIGARINVDNTGFPRIMETTVLSAVESTGMVEPGDYIIGMVNADGQAVDFEGMPIQQIIKHLRGEPGSELLLMMERASAENGEPPYPFDVPVQRSLIVIQPPY